MLFILFISFALIVSIILAIYAEEWSVAEIVFQTIGAILATVLACSFFILIIVYSTVDGDTVRNIQRYESLVYQVETSMFENDNDIAKKELVNQIQGWNEGFEYNRAMRNNVWFGLFFPDIYDHCAYIPLEGLGG